MEWEELEGILLMAYDSIEKKIGQVCVVKDNNYYHLISLEDGSLILKDLYSYHIVGDEYIILYVANCNDSSCVYSAIQNKIFGIASNPRYIHYRGYSLFYNSDYSCADVSVFSNRTGDLINRVKFTVGTKVVQKITVDDFRYIELSRKDMGLKIVKDTLRKRFNYDMNCKIKLDILGGTYNKIKKILKI